MLVVVWGVCGSVRGSAGDMQTQQHRWTPTPPPTQPSDGTAPAVGASDLAALGWGVPSAELEAALEAAVTVGEGRHNRAMPCYIAAPALDRLSPTLKRFCVSGNGANNANPCVETELGPESEVWDGHAGLLSSAPADPALPTPLPPPDADGDLAWVRLGTSWWPAQARWGFGGGER